MEDRDLSPRVEGREKGDTARPRSVSLYVSATAHDGKRERERERERKRGREEGRE